MSREHSLKFAARAAIAGAMLFGAVRPVNADSSLGNPILRAQNAQPTEADPTSGLGSLEVQVNPGEAAIIVAPRIAYGGTELKAAPHGTVLTVQTAPDVVYTNIPKGSAWIGITPDAQGDAGLDGIEATQLAALRNPDLGNCEPGGCQGTIDEVEIDSAGTRYDNQDQGPLSSPEDTAQPTATSTPTASNQGNTSNVVYKTIAPNVDIQVHRGDIIEGAATVNGITDKTNDDAKKGVIAVITQDANAISNWPFEVVSGVPADQKDTFVQQEADKMKANGCVGGCSDGVDIVNMPQAPATNLTPSTTNAPAVPEVQVTCKQVGVNETIETKSGEVFAGYVVWNGQDVTNTNKPDIGNVAEIYTEGKLTAPYGGTICDVTPSDEETVHNYAHQDWSIPEKVNGCLKGCADVKEETITASGVSY